MYFHHVLQKRGYISNEKAKQSNQSVCHAAAKHKINLSDTDISIVMLILFIGSNMYLSRINSQQLEATMYLNQYRLGSKTLTAAVQSYAVTGDQTYYDNYMKELNEDKNRDIAWEGLQKDGLTDMNGHC